MRHYPLRRARALALIAPLLVTMLPRDALVRWAAAVVPGYTITDPGVLGGNATDGEKSIARDINEGGQALAMRPTPRAPTNVASDTGPTRGQGREGRGDGGPSGTTTRPVLPGRVWRLAAWHARAAGRHAPLWLVLLALSALVVLTDDVPIAAANPPLAVASATLTGVAGLALLYLGALRFRLFGRPLDLFVGGGFGVLAVANIVLRVAVPAVGGVPVREDVDLHLLLFLRAVAAGLFFIPLLRPRAVVPPGDRRRYAARVAAAVNVPVALGAAAIVAAQERLPPAVGPRARALLDARGVVIDALPEQAAWLLLANGAIGVLMLLATVGYAARAARGDDPYFGALVAPFILLTFGQFHALLFPPAAPDYVSTALGLRLCAYLALLAAVVTQAGRDFGARAADGERRRLSRELHDGLMQLLSLLQLRLSRARAPGRDEAARAHDLAAAARVLEAALIEARQAIVALRTGEVAWGDFARALGAFADEFAANHEVAVELRAAGDGPRLDAGLQADVLRMLHEACANAVRHGGATRIAVAVAAEAGWLTVCARDDGRGFAAEAVGDGGLGLRSLAERAERRGGRCRVESAPGMGTTVRARLPLATRGG